MVADCRPITAVQGYVGLGPCASVFVFSNSLLPVLQQHGLQRGWNNIGCQRAHELPQTSSPEVSPVHNGPFTIMIQCGGGGG